MKMENSGRKATENGQSTTTQNNHPQGTPDQTPKGHQATAAVTRAPVVLWAQRADKLFLTIELEDCTNPDIKLEKDKLYFKGKSDSIAQAADHSVHEVTIEFYKPILTEDSKYVVRARGTEFIIIKDEPSWWPRLLKDSTKRHWLKVDFPKWKDEDDSEDESGPGAGMAGLGGMGGQPDFSDLMQQFGNMSGGAGDMGAFGGPGDDEDDFGESDEEDETEKNPPDLE